MADYQKINTLFKRDMSTNNIILGDYTFPYFKTLENIEWECTEKVDGCLAWNTRIQMADGTVKLIKDVKEGDVVIGYDTENNTGARQVVVQKVTERSAAGDWVKVKATHSGLNKGGSSFGNIVCTFDHKIWTPDRGYVEAYKLKAGDKILSVRRDLELNPIQKQILVGKMLGDGSMSCNDDAQTASIEFGHIHKELIDWTLRGLQELAGNVYERTSGYGSKIYAGRTKRSRQIYNMFQDWFVNGHKEVPNNIVLTPISLAFWYMDDGTLLHTDNQEDRVRFATNGFSMASCNNLLKELAKFDIYGDVKDYKGNTICLNSENSEKLFLLIFPYICEKYQYKLPERYRDCVPYIPMQKECQYHAEVVEQTVLDVTKEPKSYVRWDLTTETHNFFTTTGLVHNTNIHIDIEWRDMNDWSISFHGRTERANIPAHLATKLHQMFDNFNPNDVFTYKAPCTIQIFGEGYGVKIQKGGNYISNDVDFILFDIRIGSMWLQRESLENIASKMGVRIVPLIGYMTLWDAINLVKQGFVSLISENREYKAEGLVLKTRDGLLDRQGNRIITKIKTVDFENLKK